MIGIVEQEYRQYSVSGTGVWIGHHDRQRNQSERPVARIQPAQIGWPVSRIHPGVVPQRARNAVGAAVGVVAVGGVGGVIGGGSAAVARAVNAVVRAASAGA